MTVVIKVEVHIIPRYAEFLQGGKWLIGGGGEGQLHIVQTNSSMSLGGGGGQGKAKGWNCPHSPERNPVLN